MYANVHGTTGAVISATTFHFTKDIYFSLALAFLSHLLLDMLGEFGLTKKEIILTEIYCLILFLFCIWNTDLFWIFLSGFVAGNIMDIVDKKFYLSMLFPNKFKTTYYFHSPNEVKIPFNRNQTIASMIIGNLIMIMIWITLRN